MKIKKLYFIAVLIAMVTMLVPATQLWAGAEGGDPPDPANVQGPELWAAVVVRCGVLGQEDIGTMRVKRIIDCNVSTQAIVDYGEAVGGCPVDQAEYLYVRLPAGSLFPGDDDIPSDALPIITKIKNFNPVVDGAVTTISFDAQIKFEIQ